MDEQSSSTSARTCEVKNSVLPSALSRRRTDFTATRAAARLRQAGGDAKDRNAARVAGAQVERAFDERGLARPVGAHQAERLARRHLEIDASQSIEPAVALRQRGNAHCGLVRGSFPHA